MVASCSSSNEPYEAAALQASEGGDWKAARAIAMFKKVVPRGGDQYLFMPPPPELPPISHRLIRNQQTHPGSSALYQRHQRH